MKIFQYQVNPFRSIYGLTKPVNAAHFEAEMLAIMKTPLEMVASDRFRCKHHEILCFKSSEITEALAKMMEFGPTDREASFSAKDKMLRELLQQTKEYYLHELLLVHVERIPKFLVTVQATHYGSSGKVTTTRTFCVSSSTSKRGAIMLARNALKKILASQYSPASWILTTTAWGDLSKRPLEDLDQIKFDSKYI